MTMECFANFWDALRRQKHVSFDESVLARVLTTVDLVFLGVGSTVGVGFYILAGDVAKLTAGPAVTVCFLIAAIASVFAGLCYAEFGARVPKAGSAYVYSYVCVGEFVAFVIGWNLILEYVIGSASVARGFSGYIDALVNNTISEALTNAMPISVGELSEYPDFLAFGLSFCITGLLSLGVKESATANNIFTGINLFVIIYTIIAGATQADIANWRISESAANNHSVCIPPDDDEEFSYGTGGFSPYGFSGIMQGAATCFFGFVGFDVIATSGEETLNPSRAIPISISLCLLVVFLAYFGVSAVLTLAVPYCNQDPNAPLVNLFESHDMLVSKWIVSIGALFGFSASLFGAMFPLPRVIYAMASDGLMLRFLSRVSRRYHTPIIATILSGLFAGFMALIFDLEKLVDMMSIGTLLAYTIVALCVMLLRYSCDEDTAKIYSSTPKTNKYTASEILAQMFNTNHLTVPTPLSAAVASYGTLVFCFLVFILDLLLVLLQHQLAAGDPISIAAVTVVGFINVVNVFIIFLQPESPKQLSFKVPLVPWIPALSAFVNIYLMCNLPSDTWKRFAYWMAVGLIQYLFYGMDNSSVGYQMRDLSPPTQNRHKISIQRLEKLFESDTEEEEIYLKLLS